ncbi:signal peptidase I [Variovorax sp. J22G21]|uniref:signal peptidase I n=1 Tax=Variovorax fucosicus TaxID=3053517 RepID=UPI0025760270|nr:MULTISPECIES: signal peptidase I [unclassified Variovorax]MDM0038442.1 signal peptidase I [Variovorax sp. J22R193]MDM0063218.1 signal peptidase I [Variovorax sp. J22G21]
MAKLQRLIRDNRGFLVLLLFFGLFRTAVADWNPIPSGSMRPNLLEGDVVFVNRLAFNVKVPLTDVIVAKTAEPQRGDIVTFSSPADGTRLIKRLVALPGDVVEMRHKRLVIDGQPDSYVPQGAGIEPVPGVVDGLRALRMEEQGAAPGSPQRTIQWLPDVAARDDFGPVTVPADHFLMLGDNRDNSADSRYFGLVPRKLLIGRAERILVSADILDHWQPRFNRFGKSLY